MTPEEIQALFAARIRKWESRDVTALVADYTDDCVTESSVFGTLVGRAAVAERFLKIFAIAPDLTLEPGEVLVMGDQVVATGTLNGTGTGRVLPDGKRFSLPFVSLFTITNGQISRQRHVHDLSGHLLHIVREELTMAAGIQQALFPQRRHHANGVDVAAASVPCRAVGGDFFDYFDLSTAFGFVVGDVAGKGPPAALLSAVLQGMLSVLAQTSGGPSETLAHLNHSLMRRAIPGRFATATYGSVTPDGRFSYCNAGHNPPLLVGRASRQLRTGGRVLGMFDDAALEEETLQLDPGDLVVAYTDGVTEALDKSGAEFGEDRLQSCVEAHADLAPAALVERILDDVRRFTTDAVQSDDVTVLVMRYTGS